jgi:putative DNA primase/helicase
VTPPARTAAEAEAAAAALKRLQTNPPVVVASTPNGSDPGVDGSSLEDPPAGFRLASKITRRSIAWLLGQRIPLAEVITIAGDGGTGKSTVAHEIAARVTRGQLIRLPGGSDVREPRGVVILTTEEDSDAVVMPRLAAMGADLDRVLILSDAGDGDAPPLTLPRGADRLAEAARRIDAVLIVIDTGPSFLDAGLKSIAEEDVRRFFRPLARLARELRLAVIVVCHLNKGAGSARSRVAGNAAWINVPRSVLLMGPPPGEDPLETPERLLAIAKANLIAGKLPDAVSMTLVPGYDDPSVGIIAWKGEQAGVHASDLTSYMSSDERGDREEAMDAISGLLAGGGRPAKECEEALKAQGHSKATIRRARAALFVTRAAGTVYREGFGPGGVIYWKLPVGSHRSPSPPGGQRLERQADGDEL